MVREACLRRHPWMDFFLPSTALYPEAFFFHCSVSDPMSTREFSIKLDPLSLIFKVEGRYSQLIVLALITLRLPDGWPIPGSKEVLKRQAKTGVLWFSSEAPFILSVSVSDLSLTSSKEIAEIVKSLPVRLLLIL